MKILEAINLSKTYRGTVEVPALVDVNFSIDKGEMAAIIGSSGSGKSTLLHVLAGVDEPDSGEILIQGRSFSQLSREERTIFRRRHIGMIYQFFNLIPSLTVEKNIQLPVHLDGLEPENEFYREILRVLFLEKLKYRYPHELSGGEQQRVAIARSLVTRPAIILADEPTGNLDRKNAEEVLALLQMINQRFASTILLVTHDQEIALGCSRILQMCDGHIKEVAE